MIDIRKFAAATLGGMATLAFLAGVTVPATAAECANRGTLDARYCDEDGDLIADAPKDPAQWVDPATLIFAYTPVEDPSVYRGVWEGFLKHMEATTGKKVEGGRVPERGV